MKNRKIMMKRKQHNMHLKKKGRRWKGNKENMISWKKGKNIRRSMPDRRKKS
jgi:hypothetical protein